jgi:DNA-binding transcriptional LysR family regulator
VSSSPKTAAYDRRILRPAGWIGVELRHFLALDAIAAEASFNRAAARLGYTQSAISQQIATLERVVGQKLIERPGGSQPVRLTPAGEIVREHARAIGARLATAQADLQALVLGDLGPLRIGVFRSGPAALLPGIVGRLTSDGDDLEIAVAEARDDDELLGMLAAGQIEIAFVHLPLEAEEVEHVELLRDEYLLVVAADSPLAARPAAPDLQELAGLPLIGFKACRSREQLNGWFLSHNLQPNWSVRSDDLATIYQFVCSGWGAALLPHLATLSLGPGVTTIRLDCELPPRRLGLAWSQSRDTSGVADRFVRAATDEASRFARKRLLAVS